MAEGAEAEMSLRWGALKLSVQEGVSDEGRHDCPHRVGTRTVWSL
jgi:hypothetical protein